MFLMSRFIERARSLATLRAIGGAPSPTVAHRLILDGLPPLVAATLSASEVESLRQRLSEQVKRHQVVRITMSDVFAAVGVFLLVFLSTLPVAIPFLIVRNPLQALRLSNGIALVMLFITGWSLGTYAGRPGWRAGLGVLAIGLVLVVITIALGG
jgi:VIT1/CCC1 family predicted Fe2+/Mn2+ transporter